MKRKNVLVIASTFPRWSGDSIPDFIFALCSRLSLDNELHVIAPWYPGARSCEVMDGIHVYRFRYFPGRVSLAYGGGIVVNLKRNPLYFFLVPFFLFFQWLCVYRVLRTQAIDLIHAHWLIPHAFIAVAACLWTGRDPRQSVICSCHGTDVVGLRGRGLLGLKRWVSRRIRTLTVVSKGLRQILEQDGIDTAHCQVVPMGTDFENLFVRKRDIERDPLASVYVGRLIEQKGLVTLLNAFVEVVRACPGARLHVVGEGPLKATIEQFVATHGLHGQVQLHGFCAHDQVALLYSRCSIAVAPALVMEGFGLTLVEAMGCECVMIASDFPSARELIDGGRTGLLFQAGNVAGLASAWLSALTDRTRMEEIGRHARASVVEQYGWGRTVASFQRIYDEIV